MDALRRLLESADEVNVTKWGRYIDFFELDCRSRQLSNHTLKVNGERLSLLARWLMDMNIDVDQVTREHIQRYLLSIYGKVAPETVAGRIRTYKRFWNVLIEGGLWEGPNPLSGIRKPRVPRKIRKTISPREFELVLGACNRKEFLGYRNFTLLLLLWDCMLRRGEAAGLTIQNVDFRAGTLTVKGKGNKIRLVPIGSKTAKALHTYLNKWRQRYPGEHVFCTRKGRPITLVHIHQICSRTSRKAGISMGCHIIRHSSATEYLRRGGQLGILSKILGHSDISTTAIYTHLLTEDMVRSYDRFSPASSLHI